MKLPDDLIAFLESGAKLEYEASECECGQVILLPIHKLKLDTVALDGQSLYGIANDPNAGKGGYYQIEAVNLVSACDGYDPEFILAWLPKSQLYGTWDCDHLAMTVFPGASWSDIAKKPLPFINAQWENDDVGVPLVPWPDYPFVIGDPY